MQSSYKTPPAGNVIHISGSGNVVAGRDVLNVQRPPVIRNVIQPGPEHIDEFQRRMLFDLRTEWVTLHNTIKRNKLSDAAAWGRINKAAGSTSYHLIRRENFESAVRYIRQQMAILRSMKSAPGKDAGWRSGRIGQIKARCKGQFAGVDVYKPYIKNNFRADSLTELSDDELQKTYLYVFKKKAN